MHLLSASPRPPSLVRRVGKFGLFLWRGHPPGVAWYLAVSDALKGQNYRGISRPALAAAVRADPSWRDLVSIDGQIRSRALDLEFLRDDLASRGYRTWLALAQLGWKFKRSAGTGLIAQRGAATLQLSTDEECEMMTEIHVAGCYDFRLPGEWHVVDIGANVGMASLFFAEQPWCGRVTSFEPFARTADAFVSNLALNPTLAPKITLVRQALGETDSVLSVDYRPELRGSMSLSGVGGWRGSATAAVERVSIRVHPASLALAPVFAGLGGCRLLGKIDCEGSEYAIFRELESSGALGKFSALVIEWHGRGPAEIVAPLLRHGFAVHVSPISPDHRTLGLIYATRCAAPAAG